MEVNTSRVSNSQPFYQTANKRPILDLGNCPRFSYVFWSTFAAPRTPYVLCESCPTDLFRPERHQRRGRKPTFS